MSLVIQTKTFYIPERKGNKGKATRSQLYKNVIYKATCINVILLNYEQREYTEDVCRDIDRGGKAVDDYSLCYMHGRIGDCCSV